MKSEIVKSICLINRNRPCYDLLNFSFIMDRRYLLVFFGCKTISTVQFASRSVYVLIPFAIQDEIQN